ncbi:MAG: acyloxyacyl hydrolase [Deltaproteobacteria bacterium]|nr:acyloxyacyl hydrolase [Deltaproteobacteria bacterium]
MVRKSLVYRLLMITLMCLVGICVCGSSDVRADETNWEVGLQSGWSYSDEDESFNQTAIIVAHRLPLKWRRWDTLDVGTRLTAMASVLEGGGDTGLLGTLGLELVIGLGDSPFEVRAGGGATLMSRYKYGDEDLGGAFQFTSYVGLEYRFLESFSGYARAQHMSNAGIYSENPAVNMIMMGLRYRF